MTLQISSALYRLMVRNYLTFVIVIIIACCGYSTRSILPSHLKSIAIPVVGNETIKPGLGELLTEQLSEDFTKDRNLKITTLDRANLVLECKITNYEKSPQSYTANQDVIAWKITLAAEINAEDKSKSESLTKGNISTWITYDTKTETEEQGIGKAIEKLSQEILKNVLTTW